MYIRKHNIILGHKESEAKCPDGRWSLEILLLHIEGWALGENIVRVPE